MTIQDAIICCTLGDGEGLWMRPKGMKGEAIAVTGGYLSWRPIITADMPFNPSVGQIFAEWEVVNPYDVLRER